MRAYNLKYGFLTTYEHTLFLKQEKHGVTIVLYCSPPIGNNSWSSEDSVSLLQSLSYIQHLAEGSESDWRFVNGVKVGKIQEPPHEEKWVVERAYRESARSFYGRIDIALQVRNAPPVPKIDKGKERSHHIFDKKPKK